MKWSLNETESFAVKRPLQLQCSLSLRVHFCSSFGIKHMLLLVHNTVHQTTGIMVQARLQMLFLSCACNYLVTAM